MVVSTSTHSIAVVNWDIFPIIRRKEQMLQTTTLKKQEFTFFQSTLRPWRFLSTYFYKLEPRKLKQLDIYLNLFKRHLNHRAGRCKIMKSKLPATSISSGKVLVPCLLSESRGGGPKPPRLNISSRRMYIIPTVPTPKY